MRQTLYLMVGYPGAGKTTVANSIHAQTGAVHLWADAERQRMFAHPTLSEAESQQLYTHMNEEAGTLLAAGKSVIFDTNFNFFKDREYLRGIAAKHGADCKLLWLTTPRDFAFHRACDQAPDTPTRIIFGDMTKASFDRVADKLEPPTEAEHPIKIDGRNITPEEIAEILR